MGGIATPIDMRDAEPNWPKDDRALRDRSSWVFICPLFQSMLVLSPWLQKHLRVSRTSQHWFM